MKRISVFQKFFLDSIQLIHSIHLVGSNIERSGLGISIEPLKTSLWTALVVGQKRWCLFPSSEQTSVSLLRDEDNGERKQQEKEAITWFKTIYWKTKQQTWPKNFKPIEILQNPGETVFVPLGYWYVVINLDETIAVTQNFCSEINFETIWNCTARLQPHISTPWSKALRVSGASISLPLTIY